MYNKVVVPLDGSDLAESVLPHLEEIAKGCHIPEILLVSVTEAVKGRILGTEYGDQTGGQPYNAAPIQNSTIFTGLVYSTDSVRLKNVPVTMGKMGKTALSYLKKVAKGLEEKGFMTSCNVLVGDPPEEIVRFVEQQGADLIVMASRGTSGFNRWDMGHIAEKVVRASRVPVLLVKPVGSFQETKSKRKGKPS